MTYISSGRSINKTCVINIRSRLTYHAPRKTRKWSILITRIRAWTHFYSNFSDRFQNNQKRKRVGNSGFCRRAFKSRANSNVAITRNYTRNCWEIPQLKFHKMTRLNSRSKNFSNLSASSVFSPKSLRVKARSDIFREFSKEFSKISHLSTPQFLVQTKEQTELMQVSCFPSVYQ